MIVAADPAVQALHHIAFVVDTHKEAVGTGRCPGLLNAERLEPTPLHRLVAILAGCQ